jgi:DNA-binding NarL/FixJ family response regulator
MPSSEQQKPVILLAFANAYEGGQYLPSIPNEQRQIRAGLAKAVNTGRCEVALEPNASLQDVVKVLRTYRDRVAIFHYGGHSGRDQLLLESESGMSEAAYAEGLAALLAQQQGLKLVFLNGCGNQEHVEGLLKAGVPAVIATSAAIDDKIACRFATSFYESLASDAGIQQAFEEATAEIKASANDVRTLYRAGSHYRELLLETDQSTDIPFPWQLCSREGSGEALEWKLPAALPRKAISEPQTEERGNELILLNKVKSDWVEGVLKHSQ